MEEGLVLPFSSLVASMLLYREYFTSIEVVNFISLLENENIYIEEDMSYDMDGLALCVDYSNLDYFKIRNMMSYGTYLFEGSTVRDFLLSKSNLVILDFIERNKCFEKKMPQIYYKVKAINNRSR